MNEGGGFLHPVDQSSRTRGRDSAWAKDHICSIRTPEMKKNLAHKISNTEKRRVTKVHLNESTQAQGNRKCTAEEDTERTSLLSFSAAA